MGKYELDENSGFNDPDYYLLQESKAQLVVLETQVETLRSDILRKLKPQIQAAEKQLALLKAERKNLNKSLKKLEQENNSSIIAQSDFMEIAKPLSALDGRIAELEEHVILLHRCSQELKHEKRIASQKARALKQARIEQ